MLMAHVQQHSITRCMFSVVMLKDGRYDFNTLIVENYTDWFKLESPNKINFKISKVTNCELTNIGQLDFDFTLGGCNTFSLGVMLCFPVDGDQACYS